MNLGDMSRRRHELGAPLPLSQRAHAITFPFLIPSFNGLVECGGRGVSHETLTWLDGKREEPWRVRSQTLIVT